MNLKYSALAAALAIFVVIGPVLAEEGSAPLSQGEWERAPGQAPAADNKNQPAWLQYNSPYVQDNEDLSVNNLNAQEITTWAQEALSDVLSFGPDNYTDRLKSFQKYFIPSGWQGYSNYLTQNGLPNLVKGDGFTLNAVVSKTPDIIRQGAVQGAYRWQVRASAVLSLSRVSSTGEIKTVPSTARTVDVMIQLVRKKDGEAYKGLAIEDWRTVSPAAASSPAAAPAASLAQ